MKIKAVILKSFSIFVLIVCGVLSDNAYSKTDEVLAKEEVTLGLMGKKLYRGTANAGLGWLEISNGVQEIGNKHGIGAAATWGVVHGTGRAVQRTAVGLFEMLTFPFALTENYKPIIEPEFVSLSPQPNPTSSTETPAQPAAANTANPATS